MRYAGCGQEVGGSSCHSGYVPVSQKNGVCCAEDWMIARNRRSMRQDYEEDFSGLEIDSM